MVMILFKIFKAKSIPLFWEDKIHRQCDMLLVTNYPVWLRSRQLITFLFLSFTKTFS